MSGVETRLATISGLRVNDVEPTQPTPPFAFVGVPEIPDYSSTFGNLVTGRGSFSVSPTVTVGVSAVSDRAGQLKLAGYANPTGSTSVAAAIEGDSTLGGIVDYCVVESFEPVNLTVGDIVYFGGRWVLSVVVSAA